MRSQNMNKKTQYFPKVILPFRKSSRHIYQILLFYYMRNSKALIKGVSLTSLTNTPNVPVFRTHPIHSSSKNKSSSKTIKLPEQSSRYSVESCIQRLDLLISRNVPLSKNCALQIKQYLLMEKGQPAVESHLAHRQNTEQVLSSSHKENIYWNSIIPTDSPSTWKRKDEGQNRSLRKRTLGLKRQVKNQQDQQKQELTCLQRQVQTLQERLDSKDAQIASLKLNLQAVTKSNKDLQVLLRNTVLENLEDKQCYEYEKTQRQTQFREVQSKLKVIEDVLQAREAEIFYLWQAQLQRF